MNDEKQEDKNLPMMQKKMNIKLRQAQSISDKHRIVRFMGAVLERTNDGWKTK